MSNDLAKDSGFLKEVCVSGFLKEVCFSGFLKAFMVCFLKSLIAFVSSVCWPNLEPNFDPIFGLDDFSPNFDPI